MTEVRQDAQKSSTRPEEGELEFESGWSDFTPANQHGESRRQMMPAVHPVKRDHGMNRIADDECGVDTRQWNPVPLGAFETNMNQRVSNGSQPSRAVIATYSSAFWGGFEDSDQKSVLRTERIATEVVQTPQQQPTSQEALIGRLQQRASRGEDDALATLQMLDSMHGQYSSRMPVRMSESPPVNQRVWPDAGSRSPEKMFEVPSATHQALAQLASQGDTTALSTLRMNEAIRLTEMHSNPMGGKPGHSEPSEKVLVPKRIDTVKVIVKEIDLSTPEASENSLYTFSSTCRALGLPRSGLSSTEEEALALTQHLSLRFDAV